MGEDLENYEVTPDELGCMGETENPPGLVEETIGETKTPAPKSFGSIPFAVKQRARKLYDQFEKKDMPFEEFCIELYALQSPALMRADLQKIVLKKQDRNRHIERNLN